MPYIALQLIGMREVIAALGVRGEWPLVAAFVILAAYTYSSGLRAPALIAIVKDVMLYIMVLAAVLIIPARLGGYGHVFAVASSTLALHTPPASIILRPAQFMSYSSLALGSAMALMLYPHTITGTLSAGSDRVIRRNAALMPAYNLLLGLIALLGYVAIAAGVHTANSSSTVPLLLNSTFPAWFAGFCLAAIGIGALVPAAIMSIATANLFTRNLYGELLHRSFSPSAMTGGQEAAMAKLVSLAIKLGALAFVLLVRTQFAIELQLLGGVWILQLLPAVVGGLFSRFFHGPALLYGWFAGMAAGTAMVGSLGLRSSIYPLHFAGHVYTVYAALPALGINLSVAGIVSLGVEDFRQSAGRGFDSYSSLGSEEEERMSEQRIGLIGLGAMGMGMANSLRRAGYSVHVFDLRREVAEAFAVEGGVASDSPAEVAKASGVVVSVVVNAAQTEAVLFGEGWRRRGLEGRERFRDVLNRRPWLVNRTGEASRGERPALSRCAHLRRCGQGG